MYKVAVVSHSPNTLLRPICNTNTAYPRTSGRHLGMHGWHNYTLKTRAPKTL